MTYEQRQRLIKGETMVNSTDTRLNYEVSYDRQQGMYKMTVYDKNGVEKHHYHIAPAGSVIVVMRQYAPLKLWTWFKTGEAIQ